MEFVTTEAPSFFPALTARWEARLQKSQQSLADAQTSLSSVRANLAKRDAELSQIKLSSASQAEQLSGLTKEAKKIKALLAARVMREPSPVFTSHDRFVYDAPERLVGADRITETGVSMRKFTVPDPLGRGDTGVLPAWTIRESGDGKLHGIQFHLDDIGSSGEFIVTALLRYSGRRYVTLWIRDKKSNGSTVLLDLSEFTANHVVHQTSIGAPLSAYLEPVYTGWCALYVHYARIDPMTPNIISLFLRNSEANAHSYSGAEDFGFDLCALAATPFHSIV